ncbi:MAG: ABC transporter substrate-binding protein [Firmicutes bacterium]|nr:ABC transporter substrate-binding protein [Bacillota bacterium]
MPSKVVLAMLPALLMSGFVASGTAPHHRVAASSGKKIVITLLTPNYYPSTKKNPRVGAPVGQVDIKYIIADYEKLHPNVVIDDITPPPWSALSSWVASHAADNDLPDILENGPGYFTTTEDPSELVNLGPYLKQKNPYNPSKPSWADTFIPGLLDEANANLPAEYVVPTDWYIIHALWYNATVLNKLHLSPPKTVAQLFSDLKVIKAKDPSVVPIEGQNGYFTLPMDGTSAPWWDSVLYPIFKKITPSGGYTVSEAGLAYAYKDGMLTYNNPRVKWLVNTLYNDILPYTVSRQALASGQEASASDSPDDPFNQFVRGQIAFMPGAGYLTEEFYGANAVHPSFKVGVERLPVLTKATTPYANPSEQGSGASPGVIYAVTQEAVRQHVVKWAVNFLQYLTSVKNDQKLVNNGFRFIPGVIGAHPNKNSLAYGLATSGPVQWLTYPTVAPLNPLQDPSMNAENKSLWSYFALGEQSYQTVANEVDQNLVSWADQIIAEDHLTNPFK